ncbi:sensor histidine kinase [Amycolatopsis sp. NPDC059021]|uniref:sensor histidine kinase n=1 Tax=Amycolatopsis sp. NPDC059021 TaxID=3346704 RepID=UPI00366B3856
MRVLLLSGARAVRMAGIPERVLHGAASRFVLVPVVVRLAVLVQALWSVEDVSSLWPVVVLCLVPALAEIGWLLVWSARRPSSLRLVPIADSAYAVLLSLGAVSLAPAAQFPDVVSLTWPQLVGTVMLWTLLRGAFAGALAIGAAVALRYAMSAFWRTGPPPTVEFLTLFAAMVTTLAIVALLGVSLRFALGLGEQRGRAAERERHRRDVHDTVLQVMESLALPAPADAVDPVASLIQVRRTARAHALRLRMSLDREPASLPGGLGLEQRLNALVADMAVEGLRAEVVTLAATGDLTADVVGALHDATREALRNTLKHAGTARAVICVEETAGGIGVIVRDHGAGFAADGHRPGFGIGRSIIGRLAEVGGRARIESVPGHGTRVVLWAPLAVRSPVG